MLLQPALIPFTFPGVANVRCLFSTRLAGNMAFSAQESEENEQVRQARRELLTICNLSYWVELHQVHGTKMINDASPTDPCQNTNTILQEADGSATTKERLALAIKTADCQPVLITDIKAKAIAALHVGWRGNAANFLISGIQEFCKTYRLKPQELMAVRGPSLGPAAAEFVNFEQEWDSSFRPWLDKKTKCMNLWELSKYQLMQAGLLAHNIFSLDLCTYSLPSIFFSFRHKDAGRQISLIWKE